MLVAVSMYLVENMASVTRLKSDDELKMNAALAGIEAGKTWLFNNLSTGGPGSEPPRRPNWGVSLTSADAISDLSVHDNSGTIEGVNYSFNVYDVLYDGAAPNVNFGSESLPLYGRNEEGNYPSTSSTDPLLPLKGAYVIRSKAVFKDREKVYEQGILIWKQ
ncbi:MAG: hypothetical protein EOM62_17885 [Bacteroidia bacterium]|nr:hypothetical protein [Bacteroidia bacterium]